MERKITLITGFTFIIDQIIKYIVSNYLNGFVFIPNFISFIYAENYGAAFSMFSGNKWGIIISSIILIDILFCMLKDFLNKKKENNIASWSYGLLFGGIFGNLIDRIIHGYVIDYVSLNLVGYHFPIFNLADVAITLGVILLVIYTLKEDKKA